MAVTLNELTRVMLENSSLCCGCRRAHWLTSSYTFQVQILGFQLAHPNIYPIDDLLEHVKGPVLQI